MRYSDFRSYALFLFCFFCLRTDTVKARCFRQGLTAKFSNIALRGGSSAEENEDSFLIIKNPTFHQPLTVGDIESLSSRRSASRVEEKGGEPLQRLFHAGSRLSIVEYTRRYSRHLFRNHPTLAQLTAACLLVFSSWQIQGLTPFLNQFFVCSRRNLRKGRWISLILSSISHSDVWHVLFNLAALISLGPDVQFFIGRHARYKGRWSLSTNQAMWLLVTGAALSGSVFYLLFGEIRNTGGGCLGLSAVTMALLAVYAQAYPDRILQIRLAGIFPLRLPAYLLLQVVTVWSLVWSIIAIGAPHRSDGIAHSAHLGGLIFGLLYYAGIENPQGRFFRYFSFAGRLLRTFIK